MKKKISWLSYFISLIMLFTITLTGVINPTKAKASDSYVFQDDILNGKNNLNGTTSNSAKIGDVLIEPERGWNRYDDFNSQIKYIGDNWVHTEGQSGVYDKSQSYSIIKGEEIHFSITGQKLRIIATKSHNATSSNCDAQKVYSDGIYIGSINNLYKNSSESWLQVLVFEYTFSTYGKHNINIVHTNDVLSDATIAMTIPAGIDAIDTDGQLGQYDFQQLPSILNIESPKNNTTYTGSFDLSGYALNSSGVKSVKTYIDGVYSRDTQIGIPRADIGALYPTYPGSNNSGFSTNYKVSDFTLGTHTMKVQAIGNDGTIQEQVLYLYVYETYIVVQATDQRIPLYRYYNANLKHHFYTSNYSELGAGDPNGYVYEGIVGHIYKTQVPGTVPMYRYNNVNNYDHYYTTNYSELGASNPNGYTCEGIVGYVYNSQVQGTIPLYRYYSANFKDHFYTTNYSELGAGDPNNYLYEGIAFYFLP